MTVQELITAEAQRQGVDASLALAVAKRESGFSQSARGTSGEIGVFQLMPSTAAGMGLDAFDLGQNIRGGIAYLAQQLRTFGNTELALQAYNGGPANVQRGTVSDAARRYAAAVLTSAGSLTGPSWSPSWPSWSQELPDITAAQALSISPAMAAAALVALGAGILWWKR